MNENRASGNVFERRFSRQELTGGMKTDTIATSIMRLVRLPAFALVSALTACAAEDPGAPPFSLMAEDGSGGASSVTAASANSAATVTTVNAVSSTATVGSATNNSATNSSATSSSTTSGSTGGTATTGSNPVGGMTSNTSSTVGSSTATMTTGSATTGGATTGGATTGGAATSTTGGAPCTNIRPTGTEWDEATCAQWASETNECNMAWMIENNYCNQSCGRCTTGAFGGG
jgi:hypothetical protein